MFPLASALFHKSKLEKTSVTKNAQTLKSRSINAHTYLLSDSNDDESIPFTAPIRFCGLLSARSCPAHVMKK